MTKKYLKDNNLLAIPFDKGIGICIMKKTTYNTKLDAIIDLPQFEEVVSTRTNAKHPVLKEEERVVNTLQHLRNNDKIDDNLYEKLKPIGSQPARLYGLAKAHKSSTPVRPVLSMPGSSYYKIAQCVADWLSVVDECKINSSTKQVSDSLKHIKLGEDEELVSFDVSSLYTNVPVMEAINVCADLLYSGKYNLPPVDKETFIELAKVASCDVVMSTHRGYYRQVDGLAMGSPPAPHLANGWLSKYDGIIKGDSKLFTRYMDDILQEMKSAMIESKLRTINTLHGNLKFTIERQTDGKIPFLDMQITCDGNGNLSSTWYNKPTDTGLILNYHALAPRRYKRSVVSGFVHRISRACSTWKNFHESMNKAKRILERNQYPPSFYDPIIDETITSIVQRSISKPVVEQSQEMTEGSVEPIHRATVVESVEPTETAVSPESVPEKMIFVQYRGKCSEDYARALHKCKAPCKVVMTLRKLKTTMPSLKTDVDKELRSGTVYKIQCPSCQACYVGQTSRHILTRYKEHTRPSAHVRQHFDACSVDMSFEYMEVVKSSARGEGHLLTMEALFIEELKPTMNTKDEYRSRTLTIRFY